ncbi:MAG: DUF1232 domain-containing protein [Acidobacteriota bacterium]|nr:DUF1232 domain-containing protein [Acidobacteriota bacterium]
MKWSDSLKAKAARLKRLTLTVYYVARDPRTPFHVRALAALTAAYALSPIDLIPDFIPILGYLDDLILIPLGVALVVKLTPPDVIEAAREKSLSAARKPVSYTAAVFIVLLWLAILFLIGRWIVRLFR